MRWGLNADEPGEWQMLGFVYFLSSNTLSPVFSHRLPLSLRDSTEKRGQDNLSTAAGRPERLHVLGWGANEPIVSMRDRTKGGVRARYRRAREESAPKSRLDAPAPG